MTAITAVIPVLARPQNAGPLAESFYATNPDADLVFVMSQTDSDEQYEACAVTGTAVLTVEWEPGPGDYAKKIGAGYDWCDTPYILCGADDLRFHPGWDRRLLEIAEEYDVGVVGTNDRANPAVMAGKHSTHPLVSRCYINQRGGYVGGVGEVYCPLYDHQWVDAELVATAVQRGCYAHCHESVVEHRHPIFDRTVPSDATYVKGQAKGAEDKALYLSRQHLWLNERKAVIS